MFEHPIAQGAALIAALWIIAALCLVAGLTT